MTDFSKPQDVEIDEFKLVLTSWACPEQYNAYLSDRQVGYLRLRHGYFSVDVPTPMSKRVFASIESIGDGQFHKSEREFFLREAINAIRRELAIGESDG